MIARLPPELVLGAYALEEMVRVAKSGATIILVGGGDAQALIDRLSNCGVSCTMEKFDELGFELHFRKPRSPSSP